MEEYVQEIGLAGRDRADSLAILVNNNTWHSSKATKEYANDSNNIAAHFYLQTFLTMYIMSVI